MVRIVVDSGCDLSDEVRQLCGTEIESVALTLRLDSQEYQDDDSLDIDAYLAAMATSKNAAASAAPSPQDFLDAYTGEESVFAITLSSKLSGTFNSAMLARKLYLEKIGQKFIHVFDSLSASSGETLIALKIGELLRAEHPEAEIVERVKGYIANLKTYFLLERFDSIVKSGRMPAAVAVVASLLNIKPICAGVAGEMKMVGKARGYRKAVAKLIDMMLAEKLDFEQRILGISHCKCLQKAEELRDEIMARVPFKQAMIMETTGLCSTYANRDGVVIAY
ncbi:MAG: DegV family protein [Coriobacteriales bacterium]|jgi:DegV family protein with EDD domain|nr:DegV family protein [Coriobacteriales bacterium]